MDVGLGARRQKLGSKELNGHRKLMVLALNELLDGKHLSLNGTGGEEGHLLTTLAGAPTVICWTDINCEELRLSVWWKYDHSKHPQANLSGSQREQFHTSAPLAKTQHYPKFVGVVVSGWIERRTAKHIQGVGAKGFFDVYTRRGEKEVLDALPIPTPQGFKAEGPMF